MSRPASGWLGLRLWFVESMRRGGLASVSVSWLKPTCIRVHCTHYLKLKYSVVASGTRTTHPTELTPNYWGITRGNGGGTSPSIAIGNYKIITSCSSTAAAAGCEG